MGAALLWLSQPPIGISVIAWVSVVPWLAYASRPTRSGLDGLRFFLIAMAYWALTMQGIRHAHPAMYAALVAFAFYLACYSLAFVALVGQVARSQRVPVWIAVPVIGTGLECIRNYLLTGISAVMLGHTQVRFAPLMQLADAFGSYGITFLVLLVNSSIYHALSANSGSHVARWRPSVIALVLVSIGTGYGFWRLHQADDAAAVQTTRSTIALIGRDEEIVFIQDTQRELEIFDAYFQQSLEAARNAAAKNGYLDAVVWPESMYTGSLPWLEIDKPTSPDVAIDPDMVSLIEGHRIDFQRRSEQVQAAIQRITGQPTGPHLIVGCSVVRYGETPRMYSGVVHVGDRGQVAGWYGKTHLVMFGEYIPLIDYLPFINRFVPPGMGIAQGDGPISIEVGRLKLAPNVCIETAVERIVPQQVAELSEQRIAPDAIVSVTNDGWFDSSSIVEHHLRCSQLVAVTCRRPVLISANGGPTVWIDGSGRVIERIANDDSGFILVHVEPDGRWGLYQTIGDWPARVAAAVCVGMIAVNCVGWLRRKRHARFEKSKSRIDDSNGHFRQ